jgi:3-dehydroquinate synthase class II
MTLRCNIGDVELLVADDWQVIPRENLTTKQKARLMGINWRCWICVHDLVRLEITVMLKTV